MISYSVEVSSESYLSSTGTDSNEGISAGLLTFVQFASVYNGTSSTSPLIARSSTSVNSIVENLPPTPFGPNGIYVVPLSSATTSARISYR